MCGIVVIKMEYKLKCDYSSIYIVVGGSKYDFKSKSVTQHIGAWMGSLE